MKKSFQLRPTYDHDKGGQAFEDLNSQLRQIGCEFLYREYTAKNISVTKNLIVQVDTDKVNQILQAVREASALKSEIEQLKKEIAELKKLKTVKVGRKKHDEKWTENYKQVVEMRESGVTVKEIADTLNISERTCFRLIGEYRKNMTETNLSEMEEKKDGKI